MYLSFNAKYDTRHGRIAQIGNIGRHLPIIVLFLSVVDIFLEESKLNFVDRSSHLKGLFYRRSVGRLSPNNRLTVGRNLNHDRRSPFHLASVGRRPPGVQLWTFYQRTVCRHTPGTAVIRLIVVEISVNLLNQNRNVPMIDLACIFLCECTSSSD